MIFRELKVLELQAYNLGLTENWRLWYNVGIMDETEKAFVFHDMWWNLNGLWHKPYCVEKLWVEL